MTTPAAQSTPYDGLHSLVHWGVAPWFDSYVSSKQGIAEVNVPKKGGEATMGEHQRRVPVVKLTLLRYPRDKEEVCRAGTISASPEAKCGDP